MRTATFSLGLVVALASCARCGSKPAAELVDVRPRVSVQRDEGEPFAVGNGSAVEIGDTISTDQDGMATLRFAGGGEVRLDPDSSVFVEEGPGGVTARRVRLLFGTIEATGTASNLLVLTKLGEIVFSDLDTRASISATDDDLTVRTIIGEVRMGESAVGAGVTIRIDASGIRFEGAPDAGVVEDAGVDLGEIAAIVVTLKRGRGVVRQAGGKGRFRAVAPGEVLDPGDVVEARRNGAAIALGDTGEVQLDRRARVLVAQGDSAGTQRALELKQGRTTVVLGPGQRQAVGLGTAEARVTASTRGAHVDMYTGRRGTTLRVYEGRTTILKPDGSRVEVAADQRATVSSSGATQVQNVEASALRVSGSVRRVQVSGGLPPVTFQWSELAGGGPYIIEISDDSAFTQPRVVTEVRDNGYTTDQLGYGTVYWRVRNASKSLPTYTLSLRRERQAGAGDVRKNVVRAMAERTVILYQQWQAPQLTFKWDQRQDASQYRINIYVDGAFDQPVVEETTAEAKLKLPAGTLKDGHYVWAVSSLGPQGGILSTSDMYDLEVKFDSNKMLLRVLSPAPGARIGRGGSIETRGMVAPGTDLFINGERVKPDAAGRFEAKVSVRRNQPVIWYRVGSTLFVRTLRR